MMDAATQRQITAARPDRSTWLTANAGSGKTRVLTDRVARLLLDGVDPQNILCLTYTKAAAGEMQNRLFRTLGAWAMLPDDELRNALAQKGVEGALDLAKARRLFAGAIETPGGLKIQTIHSFCSSLLRRFPLEAQVNPQFVEADDRSAAVLRREVLDEIAGDQGDAGASFARLAALHSGADIEAFCGRLMAHAGLLRDFPADQIAGFLGADPSGTVHQIIAQNFDDLGDLLSSLAQALSGGSANDVKAAARLVALDPRPSFGLYQELASLFLFGPKTKAPFAAKLSSFPTKPTREKHPDLMAQLDPLMQLTQDLRQPILGQLAFDRTRALYDFAQHFVPAVQTRMRDRGLLGFDDLILRARDLLSRPDVAAWVLWRLDGGIDHILVDEAQDTSPEQWAVIKLLAQELAAGEGARSDRPRTLFVVGDRKQSIFSFQGADPREFNRMRDYFEDMLASSAAPLNTLSLDHSFRSAPAILDLVDRVFSGNSDALEPQVRHMAFFDQLPGRVDIWPPVEAEPDTSAPIDWRLPVDRVRPQVPKLRLARQIAQQVRHMVDHDYLPQPGAGRRRVHEGDILILVRRRDALFHAILRECKAEGLNVAGADKLRLDAEIAVRDLRALLSFLALPEDDMALACALRSPIFGLDEGQIFELAHGRKGYLWQALRARDDMDHVRAVLDDLRGQVDFLRPFEILSRILVRHGGRQKLLTRLGEEAEEGIDALLAQAMVYEAGNIPSLSDFLLWLDSEDVEVKRQLGNDTPALRVMTVHGSKGLESRIVILPDTAQRRRPDTPALLQHNDAVIWPPSAALRADCLGDLADEAAQSEARESQRLLYVGLTRAEQWLIVAAAGETEDSWYSAICEAIGDAPRVTQAGLDIARLQSGDWDGPIADQVDAAPKPRVTLPPDEALPTPPPDRRTLSPSDLGGAKAMPGEQDPALRDESMARGTALHALLEHLPRVPADQRAALAQRITSDETLIPVVLDLVNDPQIGPLLTQGRAEVAITAPSPALAGRVLAGAIDLLVVRDTEILAVDFKSNRIVPEQIAQVPEGILRQMGAYAEMLAQIWPDRTIRTAILWTSNKILMELPAHTTASAMARAAAQLDRGQERS